LQELPARAAYAQAEITVHTPDSFVVDALFAAAAIARQLQQSLAQV
jgi:hypothetical protein